MVPEQPFPYPLNWVGSESGPDPLTGLAHMALLGASPINYRFTIIEMGFHVINFTTV